MSFLSGYNNKYSPADDYSSQHHWQGKYGGHPIMNAVLNKQTISLAAGDRETLHVSLTLSGAANFNITWSSDDEDIAKVAQSGLVTAITRGETAIRMEVYDGVNTFHDTCLVYVIEHTIAVTGLSLNYEEINLNVGETKSLLAKINPANATNHNVIWSSNNEGVAAVSLDGLVTGISKGTATIIVNTDDGGHWAGTTVNVVQASDEITTIKNETGMKFVKLPAGEFIMGSEHFDNWGAQPPHKVTLTQDFWMGMYEVTQAQWKKVMAGNANDISVTPSYFQSQDDHPVESVSWYDILVFANRLSMAEGLTPVYKINGSTTPDDWGVVPSCWDDPLRTIWDAVEIVPKSTGYRLPTEAQWEYAARAGVQYTWSFGDDAENCNEYMWYSGNSDRTTHEAGTKQPNLFGLYDMYGNVWEWVWDWWGAYPLDSHDPTGTALGGNRVVRGGSWLSSSESACSAFRMGFNPTFRYDDIGFRLVRP